MGIAHRDLKPEVCVPELKNFLLPRLTLNRFTERPSHKGRPTYRKGCRLWSRQSRR